MAALQCEICGGKLIGKPGGLFECEFCGTEYDTAWAKAKIQEIKGTVKIEGTVQVAGTVKIDGGIQMDNTQNIQKMLQRMFIALRDKEFEKGKELSEQVLAIDPENAEAYLGKWMANRNITVKEDLVNLHWDPEKDTEYNNIMRYGNDEMKRFLAYVVNTRKERIQREKAKRHLQDGLKAMEQEDYAKAEQAFQAAAPLCDVAEYLVLCERNTYAKAHRDEMMVLARMDNKAALAKAASFFEEYRTYGDCAKIAEICRKKVALLEQIPDDGLVEQLQEKEKLLRSSKEELNAAKKRLSEMFIFGSREEKKQLKMTAADLTEKISGIQQVLNRYKAEYTARVGITQEPNDQLEVTQALWQLRTARKGDIIKLGRYPYDVNDEREIEWVVWSNNGSSAKLISKYVLDYIPYGQTTRRIVWAESNLCSWLTDSFYTQAFSETIRPYLSERPSTPTPGELLWEKDDFKRAIPTPYAKARGVHTEEVLHGESVCWYLKDECLANGMPAHVDYTGAVCHRNSMKNKWYDHSHDGVRPVICIQDKSSR